MRRSCIFALASRLARLFKTTTSKKKSGTAFGFRARASWMASYTQVKSFRLSYTDDRTRWHVLTAISAHLFMNIVDLLLVDIGSNGKNK